MQDMWAFLGSLTACAGFISALGLAARCNVLGKTLSRKVMHIGVSVKFRIGFPKTYINKLD